MTEPYPNDDKLRPLEVPVSSDSSSRLIRFSTFEVNLHTGELRQRGQKVKLQEQPLQLLAALLERPGELVTREELRGKLWAADTFVDFDHSLNAAIKRLRDALGESAERPIFVETVARRGYRFIGHVETPAARPPAPRSWLPTRRKAVFGALAAGTVALSFLYYGHSPKSQSGSAGVNSRRHQRWRKIYTSSFSRRSAFGLRLEWWCRPSLQLVCESRRH